MFGILVAFLSNALLAGVGEHAWRWMLRVEAVPALVYAAMAFALPESPRWLIAYRGDRVSALHVLRQSRPDADDSELQADADLMSAASPAQDPAGGFWSRPLRAPIALAFLIAFFNQMSGINAVLYFAPRIFAMAGLGAQAALLQSVGIGLTNLIFTGVGLWLIDRVGRRTLLVIGSIGYIVSLGLVAWGFLSGHGGIVPVGLFAFIAAHAVGQGAVIWVFIAEIFPNRHRAAGQALGSFTHWIFAAAITTVFPLVVAAFAPGAIFLFFAGMMALQLVWVIVRVPETKGVALEEMPRRLG